jgi:hypothetical protein
MSHEVGEVAVENILAHIGVKGMKWGVRRKATVGAQEVIVRDSRVPGSKRLVTKGGSGHPAVPAAVRAQKIGQVGKKSGLKALSDQELQDYARRIQLEQNVKRLQYTQLSPGQRFVRRLLGQAGQSQSQAAANEGLKRGGKRAIKAAGFALA